MNSKFSSVPTSVSNISKPPTGLKNNKNQNIEQDFNEIDSLVEEELSRNANNSN